MTTSSLQTIMQGVQSFGIRVGNKPAITLQVHSSREWHSRAMSLYSEANFSQDALFVQEAVYWHNVTLKDDNSHLITP